jgi:hypothetical protein
MDSESAPCHKRKHAMDAGGFSLTGWNVLGYASMKQTAIITQVTRVGHARACINSGYEAALKTRDAAQRGG